jgi:DNA-binding XRE family transcriptional regulator
VNETVTTGGILAALLAPFVPPPAPVASSDGKLWPTAGGALLWDLICRQWESLLPQLRDPANIAKARADLHLSQAELARAAGISPALISMIESGSRKASEAVAERLWSSMYSIDRERKSYVTPEILIRIEDECAVATRIEKLWT